MGNIADNVNTIYGVRWAVDLSEEALHILYKILSLHCIPKTNIKLYSISTIIFKCVYSHTM